MELDRFLGNLAMLTFFGIALLNLHHGSEWFNVVGWGLITTLAVLFNSVD